MPDLARPTAIALRSLGDGVVRGLIAVRVVALWPVRSIRQHQLWCGAPQPLQVVKLARFFAKYVHDERAVIQQRPLCTAAAFAMQRRALHFFVELIFDFTEDRL